MLLMALENLQAGFQQALQLGVLCRRDQRGLQRLVDLLVIGDLVIDISLVEGGTLELFKLGFLALDLLGQRLAGGVVFRRDLQFLDKVQRLHVHRLMVANHVLGKADDILVMRLGNGKLRHIDVQRAGGVGDVGDLRIGGFIGRLGERRGSEQAKRGYGRERANMHKKPPWPDRPKGVGHRFSVNTHWMQSAEKRSRKKHGFSKAGPYPYSGRPSRFSTATVTRSQRLPANGNASRSTGPICASSCLRNRLRARKSRVLTVSGLMPS